MKKPNFQKINYFSAPLPSKIFISCVYDSQLTLLTSLNVSYFYLHHTRHNKFFIVKNQKTKYIFLQEMTFFPIVKTEKKILSPLDHIISMLLLINAHSVFEHVFQPNKQKN